jgi:DNA-binding beta-propeller fold protein YncE
MRAQFTRVCALTLLFVPIMVSTAIAHPGGGIVVDRKGHVYFVDTGSGVWKLDEKGRLSRHPGAAFHWLTLDPRGRFTDRDMPRNVGGELPVVGPDPTLILSSDFPVAFGSDGAFYYPQAGPDHRVRIMRKALGAEPSVFATLPLALERGPTGKSEPAPWVHGIAAGPHGSLYYAEQAAERRIAPDGTISTIAEKITVSGCVHPAAITDDRIGPGLRSLDVTRDGTVYVAASACCALLKITPDGTLSVVARGDDSWSPTGVAVSGNELYILEYRYIPAERREDWIPRVRKVASDGTVSVVATVKRR